MKDLNPYILWAFVIAFAIFSSLFLVSAAECLPISEIGEIPCEIKTDAINCTENANISSLANLSVNYSVVMGLIDATCTVNCSYNFSFNYSQVGAYNIEICSMQHRVIHVVAERNILSASTTWAATEGIPKIPTADEIDAKIKAYFTAYLQIAKKYLFFVVFGGLILFLAFKKKKSGTKEAPLVVQGFKK